MGQVTAERKEILIGALFTTMGALVLFHILSVSIFDWSFQAERLFNLDLENNVPAWFSSFLWILSAFASYRCSEHTQDVRQKNTWKITALFMLFLSCDEIVLLHEHTTSVIKRYVLSKTVFGDLDLRSWPFILAPFVIPFIAWIVWRLRGCLKGSRQAAKYIVLGGFIFFSGCLGMESLGILTAGKKTLFMIEVIVEEVLEMVGVILILTGLITHSRHLEKVLKKESF